MSSRELARLRRARATCNQKLRQVEALLTIYQNKLTKIEFAIYAIAPELDLAARRHRPNPIFKFGEPSRFALTVLREEGEPLPVRVLVVQMLAMKGLTLPDPRTRHEAHKRIRIMLSSLEKRWVVRRIGKGRKAKWCLHDPGSWGGGAGGEAAELAVECQITI